MLRKSLCGLAFTLVLTSTPVFANCSTFIDNLANIPLYDNTVSINSYEQKKRVFESLRHIVTTNETNSVSHSGNFSAIIEGIPVKGSTANGLTFTNSLADDLSEERLELVHNSLYQYEATQKLNSDLTGAIKDCLQSAQRGLKATVFLKENWREFDIQVGFSSMFTEAKVNFGVAPSENFELVAIDNAAVENQTEFELNNTHTMKLTFKRKQGGTRRASDAGTILLNPVTNKPTFNQVEIAIPEATKIVRAFEGDFLIETNWYNGGGAAGEPLKFPYRFKTLMEDRYDPRSYHKLHDWLHIAYSPPNGVNSYPKVEVFLSAPHGNPVDGIAEAQTSFSKFDQPTGRFEASNHKGRHHAYFNAVLLTRLKSVNAEDFDEIIARSKSSLGSPDDTIYIFDERVQQIAEELKKSE